MACLVALSSCDDVNRGQVYVNQSPNVVVTPTATNLGDNLDLQALGELVRSSTTAQEVENKLNTTGSINNLDLDGDGNVDYIKVTEYGNGDTKGFSFTVDLPNGEKQELATIDIQKNANGAAMNIQGNQQVYGNGAYYQSHYNLSDLMIMHYLFSYHSPYYSPYRYGYYPSYYHSYRSAPSTAYRSRVSTTTRTSRITRSSTSKITSPNSSYSSKAVNSRAQSLASPTRSQKSFSTTSSSNSRPTTSGFGKKSSSGSSWFGSSSRSSSSSSPSRSSSFGSSSRSSGSSFGSSSRSSSSRSSSSFGSSSRSSGSSSRRSR